MQLGVSAVVCYLHACRHQNEAKCRKYLARTIWLMTYDDEKVCINLQFSQYFVVVVVVVVADDEDDDDVFHSENEFMLSVLFCRVLYLRQWTSTV